MNAQQLKQLSLTDYLASIGHHPSKRTADAAWYLSPFRKEDTPSFKVNETMNLWYDHGIGKGGSIIDFTMIYFTVTFEEAIQQLNHYAQTDFSFHRQPAGTKLSIGSEKEKCAASEPSPFRLLSITEITDGRLTQYIEERGVQLQTARIFCHQLEIFNSHENFRFHAIGFQNRSNGFEIRTPQFKGCYAPKDFTFIDKESADVTVVEGFFDLLSAVDHHLPFPYPATNWLVLNSLSQAEKTEEIIQRHRNVYLMLDNDKSGKNGTQNFIRMARNLGASAIDLSHQYEGYKDINEWAVQQRWLILNNRSDEEKRNVAPRRYRGFGR